MTVFYLNGSAQEGQAITGPGQVVPMTIQSTSGTGPNPPTQTVAVVVSGTGNVSATVQLQGSNDDINWQNAGTAITIASGASPQLGNTIVNSTWQFFRGNITALTGTNASATVTMAL